MLDAIRERAEVACRDKVFPGSAIGILRRGADPEYVCAGGTTYDVNARAVRESVLYDVASVTKSIPTASLALLLIAEGRLKLEDRVRSYLPELQNDYDATVRDLLAYRVAGARLSELRDLSAERMLQYIFERGFDGPPGESQYTNLPSLLLGLVIERALNSTLDILARRYFFDPLRMSDTAFFAGATFARAAPTELEDWRGMVSGETHDESAYILAKAGRIAGHAGLFSTAPDLLAFLKMLLDAGDKRGCVIAEGAESGLGWQVHQPYFMGSYAAESTFGKTGFTGTSVVVDRPRGVAFVILSNRTFPKRPPNHDAINAFRADIADIVLGTVH